MAVAHRACFVAGLLFILLLPGCEARIHKLTLKNEIRHTIDLNNFGFYANGTLDVHLHSLQVPKTAMDNGKYPVGFSLSRSRVNGVLSYTAEELKTCPFTHNSTNEEPLILFVINMERKSVNVTAVGYQDNILMAKEKEKVEADKGQEKVKRASEQQPKNQDKPAALQEQADKQSDDKKSEQAVQNPKAEAVNVTGKFNLSSLHQVTLDLEKIGSAYSFSFHMVFGSYAEGLYSLKFHYCRNLDPGFNEPYSFAVEVTEKNPDGYLSAAEIPLPRLYLYMAGVFFIAALVWVYNLMKHRYTCTMK